MRTERGLSFIEVMISMAILAIGVTGVVSILTETMEQNTASRLQGVAALEASIMATDIQTNTAYWQGITVDDTAPDTASTACNDVSCTPADLAAEDLDNWGHGVAQALPQGKGIVDCSTNTTVTPNITLCRIGVSWTVNQGQWQSLETQVVNQEYVLMVQP